MDGFALWSPDHGWFACRDGDNAVDLFDQHLFNACVFRSEDEAFRYSVALTERHAGSCWWIYGVSFLRRRGRALR